MTNTICKNAIAKSKQNKKKSTIRPARDLQKLTQKIQNEPVVSLLKNRHFKAVIRKIRKSIIHNLNSINEQNSEFLNYRNFWLNFTIQSYEERKLFDNRVFATALSKSLEDINKAGYKVNVSTSTDYYPYNIGITISW